MDGFFFDSSENSVVSADDIVSVKSSGYEKQFFSFEEKESINICNKEQQNFNTGLSSSSINDIQEQAKEKPIKQQALEEQNTQDIEKSQDELELEKDEDNILDVNVLDDEEETQDEKEDRLSTIKDFNNSMQESDDDDDEEKFDDQSPGSFDFSDKFVDSVPIGSIEGANFSQFKEKDNEQTEKRDNVNTITIDSQESLFQTNKENKSNEGGLAAYRGLQIQCQEIFKVGQTEEQERVVADKHFLQNGENHNSKSQECEPQQEKMKDGDDVAALAAAAKQYKERKQNADPKAQFTQFLQENDLDDEEENRLVMMESKRSDTPMSIDDKLKDENLMDMVDKGKATKSSIFSKWFNEDMMSMKEKFAMNEGKTDDMELLRKNVEEIMSFDVEQMEEGQVSGSEMKDEMFSSIIEEFMNMDKEVFAKENENKKMKDEIRHRMKVHLDNIVQEMKSKETVLRKSCNDIDEQRNKVDSVNLRLFEKITQNLSENPEGQIKVDSLYDMTIGAFKTLAVDILDDTENFNDEMWPVLKEPPDEITMMPVCEIIEKTESVKSESDNLTQEIKKVIQESKAKCASDTRYYKEILEEAKILSSYLTEMRKELRRLKCELKEPTDEFDFDFELAELEKEINK